MIDDVCLRIAEIVLVLIIVQGNCLKYGVSLKRHC